MKMVVSAIALIAAWIVVSAPAMADEEAVIKAMEALTARIIELEGKLAASNSIPSGAVVAFVSECPPKELGWEPYTDGAGKFILGGGVEKGLLDYRGPHIPAGKKQGDRTELTLVKPGDQGGEELHSITSDELPNTRPQIKVEHNGDSNDLHISTVIPANSDNPQVGAFTAGISNKSASSVKANIAPLGNGTAGNNMPPYIALTYCKKF